MNWVRFADAMPPETPGTTIAVWDGSGLDMLERHQTLAPESTLKNPHTCWTHWCLVTPPEGS